jgi:ABC-type spermidine/putrescine transport system permease subunit II
MKKMDKVIILALSASTGFAILSAVLYYSLKNTGFLLNLDSRSGAEAFIAMTIAAICGTYLAALIAQGILKSKVSLLRLTLGAILGYELGISLELLVLFWQRLVPSRFVFYSISIVVLLCGYLGALIGARFEPKEKQQKHA